MEWLNYHHLLYFWFVAKEGSISRAGKQLRLAQPTISGQLRELERQFGEKLFVRNGRNLELTEMGQTVLRYADEIFSLGRELQETVKGRPTGGPLRFVVGVADVLPKLIAHHLLSPALSLEQPVRIVCRAAKTQELIASLAEHQLDMVLADAPAEAASKFKAYNHLLGECTVSVLGAEKLPFDPNRPLPTQLDGAAMLLPSEGTTLRRSLEIWFETEGIKPKIVGEFDDSALMKVFAQQGAGCVVAPSIVESKVCAQYELRPLGRIENVRERFFAITAERKLKNPAAHAIASAARDTLFS